MTFVVVSRAVVKLTTLFFRRDDCLWKREVYDALPYIPIPYPSVGFYEFNRSRTGDSGSSGNSGGQRFLTGSCMPFTPSYEWCANLPPPLQPGEASAGHVGASLTKREPKSVCI